MAYDEKLDVVLWKGSVGNLQVTVQKYKDGEAKLQIGPRLVVEEGKEDKFFKAGRLTAEEFDYIIKSAPEIKKAMTGTASKKK